jgi:diguanylate cyclase (GGDEF)-like protein
MKFSIAWRLGIALAMVGVLATGLTGYYGYTESRSLLQTAAEQRLLTATKVLARQLSVGLDGAAQDVRLIAGHPATRKLLMPANRIVTADDDDDMAQLFKSMLRTHPEYMQLRLIAASAYGLERIRVDRSDDDVVRVVEDDLQEKGHYPYVVDTLQLPDRAVYVSRAGINHEVGAHASLGKPSIQVATPVYSLAGRVLGLVVVNIDLDGLFAQLAADLPAGLNLYLANGEGDFLIHPDPAMAFAFDRGQRALVQDTFPTSATLLSNAKARQDQVVTAMASGPQHSATVAAFVRQPLSGLHSEDDFIIGIGQPLQAVLADSDRLGAVILRIVLGLSVLSMLLAAVLARALSRPLLHIVKAIRHIGTGVEGGKLPSDRRDEIGMLARSIEEMQQQIRAQFANLEQKQAELDRLASHDALTGLPNRRLFLEHLQQAMSRAKRHQGKLAVLFIDLDNFKDINDTVGHAAGDAVLHTIGQRLGHLLREVDTVARLGGDEFIILLDDVDDVQAIEHVAQRVLEAMVTPVPYGDEDLVCGGSVGIARYPHDAHNVTELIASADKAMYRAKNGGRQRLCFASTDQP